MTRVTQATIQRGALDGLAARLGRMQQLQEQLATGRSVNRPSDSPVGTVSSMQYRSNMRRTEQHMRNAQDGLSWLASADQALTGTLGVVRRVRELVVRGANASIGTTERAAIAAEIDTLRENLVGIANTKYLDRPIFAGNSQLGAAYGPTGTYLGAAVPEAIERSVASGVSVRVNLTGPEVFGTPGADLFVELASISDHLRNDPDLLSADIAVIDARTQSMQNQLAKIGARYNQVESMRDRAGDDLLTMRAGLSDVEDIDLPATIVDLQMQEVAYKVALGATARVIQPSLLDFLR